MTLPRLTGQIIAFRRYWLAAGSRLLIADGALVEISARALDLLITLINARGEPVSLDDIKQSVWPQASIASNTVQVLVSGLRKALQDDADLIATVPGRGYRFADTLRIIDARDAAPDEPDDAMAQFEPAPAPATPAQRVLDETPFIGRHAELSELLALVSSHRVVSLTGAIGVGKTRLAAEVAKRLVTRFSEGTIFVKLATHLQRDSVADALAAAARLEPNAALPAVERLIRLIGTRKILLVVDHCDHLVEEVRHTLETLIAATPELRVIVTSETPLFISGEHVIALASLATPAPGSEQSAAKLGYDSLRLLFGHLTVVLDAQQSSISLRPQDDAQDIEASPGSFAARPFVPDLLMQQSLEAASAICRRLDGLPFALELAASTIAQRTRSGAPLEAALCAYAYELEETLLRRSGTLRVTLPRTMLVAVALELLYDSLEPDARIALQRLSIFVSNFSPLAATRLLAGFDTNDAPVPVDAQGFDPNLGSLARTGLLKRVTWSNQITLRLPEPVRLFALAILDQRNDFAFAAQRHARHVLAELRLVSGYRDNLPDAFSPMPIDDLRAALGWSSRAGKFDLCIALLDQSAPCWVALSLIPEYIGWIHAALARVEATPLHSMRDEMRLHCVLASALALTRTPYEDLVSAWRHAYVLANACADTPYRLRALRGLLVCAFESGQINWARALHTAYTQIFAKRRTPPQLSPEWIEGVLLSYGGVTDEAIARLQRATDALAQDPHTDDPDDPDDSHESGIISSAQFLQACGHLALAVSLWLAGHPRRAMQIIQRALDEASGNGHPIPLCVALAIACGLSALDGDIANTERYAATLVAVARNAGLRRWLRAGLDCQSWLNAQRGDTAATARIVDHVIVRISRQRLTLLDVAFIATLANHVNALGRVRVLEALRPAIERCWQAGERWHAPELVRIEARLRLLAGEPPERVRPSLVTALHEATRYGSRRLVLRIAVDLATLDVSLGDLNEARDTLVALLPQIADCAHTEDWGAANAVFAELMESSLD